MPIAEDLATRCLARFRVRPNGNGVCPGQNSENDARRVGVGVGILAGPIAGVSAGGGCASAGLSLIGSACH